MKVEDAGPAFLKELKVYRRKDAGGLAGICWCG